MCITQRLEPEDDDDAELMELKMITCVCRYVTYDVNENNDS